jgi:hypothetical protein
MIYKDVIDYEEDFRKRADVKMYMTFSDSFGKMTYWIKDDCDLSEQDFEDSCRKLEEELIARIISENKCMMAEDEDIEPQLETHTEFFVKEGVDEDGEIEWIEREMI